VTGDLCNHLIDCLIWIYFGIDRLDLNPAVHRSLNFPQEWIIETAPRERLRYVGLNGAHSQIFVPDQRLINGSKLELSTRQDSACKPNMILYRKCEVKRAAFINRCLGPKCADVPPQDEDAASILHAISRTVSSILIGIIIACFYPSQRPFLVAQIRTHPMKALT
jgi:hypothetical protein